MKEMPSYMQSFGFSCGPAALMMVMKDLREDLDLDRDLELDIWRDATLMESKATSSFGLALAAKRRGFVRKKLCRQGLLSTPHCPHKR